MRNYFYKPVSKVHARYKFTMRIQAASESVHEYVTELQVLARDCKFGALE